MRRLQRNSRSLIGRAGALLVSGEGGRRAILPCALVVVTVALSLLALDTGRSAPLSHLFPYLVIPLLALAYVAADRRARTPSLLVWAAAVSLLVAVGTRRYSTVEILGIAIPTFGALAVVLAIGIACLRLRGAMVRIAYPLIAGIAVLAILLIPLSEGWGQFRDKWREQVADIRAGGALHEAELGRVYRADNLALMRIIQQKTPEDAVIAFPGQSAFPIVGNPELVNYFLYPRTIKSANTSRTPVFDSAGASYIVGVAQGYQNSWPVFSVPVRMYYHPPALHRVQFGELTMKAGRETTTVAPADLQPWQTDADRSITGDMMGGDGTRTVSSLVSASASDPWMAAVSVPLAPDFSVAAPVATNAGDDPAMDEQVALLAEVQGPGGERAVFVSAPAMQTGAPQTLTLSDLARRAGEYARARGWRAGPLTVTRLGLEMGWQVPLSQTKTNTLAVIERGDRTPAGPETFGGVAGDAQRHLQAGNPNAAIDLYAAGLLLRPNNLDGQLALGEALRAAGRWADGTTFFIALLNDYPSDPWIRYSLAVMQRGSGERTAARATLAPVVSDTAVVRVTRAAGAPKPGRGQVTATVTSSGYGAEYEAAISVRYDTGDGTAGQLYVSANGGPETLEMAGASGGRDLRASAARATVEYRLYAGADHAQLLDAVRIEYLHPLAPSLTLWANMLDAQLAAELGDLATARAAYRLIIATYPGEYQPMAEAALAALDREK